MPALLALIVLCSIAYSVLFVIGPSHMGDDIAYSFFAHYAASGTFVQNTGDILSIRILHIIPIGFFYALFGAGRLTSAAWDITTFALSVALAFLIGKEIYDERVGLLAAFLLAIFPLGAMYAVTMSDNIPMMFFVGLAALLLIKALKKNSKAWYFAAGAALVAPPLTIPEGFVLWIVVGLFLLVELLRRKISVNRTTLFFIYGFVAAIGLLLLFNYVNCGSPLITFTSNVAYYGQTWRPDLLPMPVGITLAFYPGVMFPYGIAGKLYSGVSGHGVGLQQIWANTNSVGFYFYAFVLAALYLAFKRDKRAYFLLFWFIVGVAYLEFGPQHVGLNPFSYILSHRLDRYLTLVAYPLVILIASALFAVVRSSKKALRRAAIVACSLVVLFLAATAIPSIAYSHGVAVAGQYSEIQAANYLNPLPNTTRIYADSGYGDLSVYMGFDNLSRFMYDYDGITDCHDIPAGSYVLFPRYPAYPAPMDGWPSACGWGLVLSPVPTGIPEQEVDAAQSSLTDLYYVNASNGTRAG